MQDPDRFEYYLRSESGVHEYSAGSWRKVGDNIILSGFNNGDLKQLPVESNVTTNTDGAREKIVIQYVSKNTLSRAAVMINDHLRIAIAGDTVLLPGEKIKTLAIRSYLSYNGLLSVPPRIDTLYSPVIKGDDTDPAMKTYFLKFTVNPADFSRVTFSDTISVKKGGRVLLSGKGNKLRKM